MSEYSNPFFRAINVKTRIELIQFSTRSGVPVPRLQYYNKDSKMPTGRDLHRITTTSGLTEHQLRIALGRLNSASLAFIQSPQSGAPPEEGSGDQYGPPPRPVFQTALGTLYQHDCLEVLRVLEDESVDLIFADPPFNLNKLYPSGINDNLKADQYIEWCERWIEQCIRVLRWGGSFFIWNIPRWNIILSNIVDRHLTFRHWIAVDIKYTLPIQGRLYPSHYSLLYFIKGDRPRVFHPDRLPMEICPECMADLRDYGGYKAKMNPNGVNLTDVWFDIPPVRHSKYKKRVGANELSIKLLDRVIEMSSDPGDVVLDPFGGSGTTFAVAEIKKRRWIGIEIGDTSGIVSRLRNLEEESQYLADIRKDLNRLFTEDSFARRQQLGLWTDATVRKR